MTLTAAKINSIKPTAKSQKFVDGQGLYLFVPAASLAQPTNARERRMAWRFDYRYAGKRYTLSLGSYPTIGLAEARNRRHDARRLLESDENPAQVKRQDKLLRIALNANSFESLANAWYQSKQERRSKTWKDANSLYLRRDLAPKIGCLPIAEVSTAILIQVLESAKKKYTVKTADRIRQTAVQIFDYAIRKSKMETNPARLLQGWEEIPQANSHLPLIGKQIPEFLERVDAYSGQMVTKLCMKLLMLTFVRKCELIEAKWTEFDFSTASWLIPAERMKMKDPHLVPLSTQSLEALEQLKHHTGHSQYAFPSTVSDERPMSSSTLNVAFRNIGYGDTFSPHGVRTTASTWLNEQGFRSDVIERQLAHAERNRIRAIYNNATYLSERIKMMQSWADFVDPQS
jgi:integrase